MYTVDYFINKFEAIPEEQWCTGFFQINQQCCANGHCGSTDKYPYNDESEALAELLSPLKGADWTPYDGDNIYEATANINDGYTMKYQQPTPKQRILAALYDIKALEQKKDIDTGGKKEKIVYVAVPVTITEQAKELVLS